MFVLRTLSLFVVLACLIHIFAVIATPLFAGQKVWQRVVDQTPPRRLKILKSHEEAVTILGQADPSMAYAVCHFSMDKGPVSLVSDGPTSFWNVTLFNNAAEVIYSLHDDASRTNQLNLSIEPRVPISEAKTNTDEDNAPSQKIDKSVPIPSPSPLSDKLEETEETIEAEEADLGEEDGGAIKALVKENQIFVVVKIFKESRHHRKLIEQTLEAAQCK